jgi:hypothetical protein
MDVFQTNERDLGRQGEGCGSGRAVLRRPEIPRSAGYLASVSWSAQLDRIPPDLHHKRRREANQSDSANLPSQKYGRLQERISSIFLAAIKVLLLPCPQPIQVVWAFFRGGNIGWLGESRTAGFLFTSFQFPCGQALLRDEVPSRLYSYPPERPPKHRRRADGGFPHGKQIKHKTGFEFPVCLAPSGCLL